MVIALSSYGIYQLRKRDKARKERKNQEALANFTPEFRDPSSDLRRPPLSMYQPDIPVSHGMLEEYEQEERLSGDLPETDMFFDFDSAAPPSYDAAMAATQGQQYRQEPRSQMPQVVEILSQNRHSKLARRQITQTQTQQQQSHQSKQSYHYQSTSSRQPAAELQTHTEARSRPHQQQLSPQIAELQTLTQARPRPYQHNSSPHVAELPSPQSPTLRTKTKYSHLSSAVSPLAGLAGSTAELPVPARRAELPAA